MNCEQDKMNGCQRLLEWKGVLIKQKQLSYYGHVLQKSGDYLKKEMIQGTALT